jgi:hypothetical protein
MIPLPLLAFAQLLLWEQGTGSAAELRARGITRIAVPPDRAAAWQQAGFEVVPVSREELAARISLDPPGVDTDAIASASQRPWVDANGWRFLRQPGARYVQAPPAGRGALAVAEAHVFGADAIFRVHPPELLAELPAKPAELPALATVLAQLRAVPSVPWPDVAQIEVVDDGSERVGEVMNLLSRRNLLWRPRATGQAGPALVVQIGTPAYPEKLARSPDQLVDLVRRRLGDDRRALRVYGSETVLCRLQAQGQRARVSLLNYGGRIAEGVRLRLRGSYPHATAVTDRVLPRPPLYQVDAGNVTELTVPPFRYWAVVDLDQRRRPRRPASAATRRRNRLTTGRAPWPGSAPAASSSHPRTSPPRRPSGISSLRAARAARAMARISTSMGCSGSGALATTRAASS